MRIALCPGSYDPVTVGHINIIERAAKLFDKVIVLVMVNPTKEGVFSADERVELIDKCITHLPNVEADSYVGLVADYARDSGACALVKGLRAVSDFEYEFQMAMVNKKLHPELETFFISTDSQYMYYSSSAVRQIGMFGGSLEGFLPPEIEKDVVDRLDELVGRFR